MKARRLFLFCFYITLTVSGINAAEIEGDGHKSDFTATPNYLIPYPILKQASGLKEKCIAKVIYRDGKIASVQMDATSGNEAVNQAILEHIQNTYIVKPGKSGWVLVPIRLPGLSIKDFESRPNMLLPYQMVRKLKGLHKEIVVILYYKNGTFTKFDIYQSSGNEKLDELVLQHVNKNFRLKPGVTGSTVLPVNIHL